MKIGLHVVKRENHARAWIIGLAGLVDSLVVLASFGCLSTTLALAVALWTVDRD